MAFGFSDEVLAAFVPPLTYWIASGFYELLAYLRPDSCLHTKEEEDQKNIVSRFTVLKAVIAHHAGQIFLIFLALKFTGQNGGIPKPEPSFLVSALQFLIAIVVLDTWNYFGHRYMHTNKFLYKLVHAKHHGLVVPYSYGTVYGHWLDGLLVDNAAGVAAVLISGMTPKMSIYVFSLANIKGVDLHCGMWLPWSPFQMFFGNNAAFHETHHQLKGNHCNYGQPFFLTWDKILGTYKPFTVEKRKGGGYEVMLT